jgi:hypothetical protein
MGHPDGLRLVGRGLGLDAASHEDAGEDGEERQGDEPEGVIEEVGSEDGS